MMYLEGVDQFYVISEGVFWQFDAGDTPEKIFFMILK